jgi:hypothetical protein
MHAIVTGEPDARKRARPVRPGGRRKRTRLAGTSSAAYRNSYASVAADEGYQWGGGCWNDNNRDDQPGDQEGGTRIATESFRGNPDFSAVHRKAWSAPAPRSAPPPRH